MSGQPFICILRELSSDITSSFSCNLSGQGILKINIYHSIFSSARRRSFFPLRCFPVHTV